MDAATVEFSENPSSTPQKAAVAVPFERRFIHRIVANTTTVHEIPADAVVIRVQDLPAVLADRSIVPESVAQECAGVLFGKK